MLGILIALVVALGGAPAASKANPPHPIARQLAAELRTHPLILIAEHHRSRQDHELLRSLVQSPEFVCHIDDIVVEFGNARLQGVADRYVGGGGVSDAELASVWRETGQMLTWDSPVYEQFFATVRELNRRHVCRRPVRIVLGDPPIDWATVHDAAAYRQFADRDRHYADVVEREVLARGHRALLIAGGMHDLKAGPVDSKAPPGLGEIIATRHPGKLFVVWTLPPDASIAKRFGLTKPFSMAKIASGSGARVSAILPEGIMVQRTVNGEKVWRPMGDLPWPPLDRVIDAVVYVGADKTTVDPDPSIYRDPAYQAELRRRARILKDVFGLDFESDLDAELAKHSS